MLGIKERYLRYYITSEFCKVLELPLLLRIKLSLGAMFK